MWDSNIEDPHSLYLIAIQLSFIMNKRWDTLFLALAKVQANEDLEGIQLLKFVFQWSFVALLLIIKRQTFLVNCLFFSLLRIE